MRMGQEQIAAGANLFGRQMGQFIPAVTTLIAAIHDKGRVPALNIITVTLLGTGFARQIEFHAAATSKHNSHIFLKYGKQGGSSPKQLCILIV